MEQQHFGEPGWRTRDVSISSSVALWMDGKKLATSSLSAQARRWPFAVAARRNDISRSLAASAPLPRRQAYESWMKWRSNTGSLSSWGFPVCRQPPRKVAAGFFSQPTSLHACACGAALTGRRRLTGLGPRSGARLR
jgi:hypothetical protein